MRETSLIEIDLSAVAHNLRVMRRIVGDGCAICPIVKADAYGLGAVRIAKCVMHAGADMLAVYTPDQAAELFQAAVSGSVLLLMPLREIGRADDLYLALTRGRLHLSVHDDGHVDDLVRMADRFAVRIPVHLDVDTGMSRGGCNLADAQKVLERIDEHPRLHLAGLYTHFACAAADEEGTERQNALFDRLIAEHRHLIGRDCLIHAANTSAAIRHQRYHKTMVRVGLAWIGCGLECIRGGGVIAEAEHLQHSVTWSSRIGHLKEIEAGTPVGYGSMWTSPRRSLIGLVPVGYADGYPLALSAARGAASRASVAVIVDTPAGPVRAYAPLAGRVNMDQITIDLTDLGGRGDELSRAVRVGSPVELITAERGAPNDLTRLAEAAGTIPYEILCRLNPRIRRVYHQPSATVEVFETTPAPAAAG
jgi:alanine racemase